MTSVKRANNSYASFQYDDANRLNELKNYKNDGTVLNSYKYKYDPNSNQTSIATDKGTVSYEYDALNQLTKETLTDGTAITYEYDAAGNRTKKIETKGTTTTTTTYTYNAGNELTNVSGQAYTYDLNGNLTNDGDKTYINNEENQLVEVKDMTGNSLGKFTYDHEGKRISMTTSAGTTNFHYNGDKVIAETDANNAVTAEFTWDAQGNPVSMVKGGKTYYYHINGHGDVTALTDEIGNVVAEYQYDAWGNTISSTGAMKDFNPYRYAGYRYDSETGLYYLMARYYNTKDGRFISRDTFHGFEEEPISLNNYSYTKNSPANYIDPSGHYWKNAWWNSKNVVTGAIDKAIMAIVLATGGGLALFLKNLSKKYTAKAAKIMFADQLKKKLRAIGISYGIASFAASAATALFEVLLWYSDPASKIFQWMDAHDKYKNNGYFNYI